MVGNWIFKYSCGETKRNGTCFKIQCFETRNSKLDNDLEMHHDIILSFARVSQSIVGQPRLFTSYVKVMVSEAKTMKQTIVTLENQSILRGKFYGVKWRDNGGGHSRHNF